MKLQELSTIGLARAVKAGKPSPAINPATGTPLEPEFFPAGSDDMEKNAPR